MPAGDLARKIWNERGHPELPTSLQRYAWAVTHGDENALAGLWAEQALLEDPVGGGASRVYRGRPAIMDKWSKVMWVRRPMMVCTSGFGCGPGSVAAHFSMSLRSKSGGRVSYPLFMVFELDDGGQIAAAKAYWDRQALASQLA